MSHKPPEVRLVKIKKTQWSTAYFGLVMSSIAAFAGTSSVKAAGRTPKKSTPKKTKPTSSVNVDHHPAQNQRQENSLSTISIAAVASSSAAPHADLPPVLSHSKKRSEVETPGSREKEEPSKKRVKFVEPNAVARPRGLRTPPNRKMPQAQHLGISPIKFDAGQSREVYWAPEMVTGSPERMEETRHDNPTEIRTYVAADLTHFSSVWDILHQDTTEHATEPDSAPSPAAKTKISLSSLFEQSKPRHRDPNRRPTAPPVIDLDPATPAPDPQSPALPTSDVKALLQRLSSLDATSATQYQYELDDSIYEQPELLDQLVVSEHSTTKTATPTALPLPLPSAIPAPPMPIAPPPTLVSAPIKTVPTLATPTQAKVSTPAPILPTPATSNPPIALKSSLWGNRLSKAPLVPPHAPLVTPKPVAPPPPEPNFKRSLTTDVSGLPSSQSQVPMTSNVSLSRYVSEPVLSQSSHAPAKEAAKDVLSWIEAAGFTYEDIFDSSPTTTTTAPSTFFEGEGEKPPSDVKSKLESRPVDAAPIYTPNTSEGAMSDDDIVERYSQYYDLPEEIGAELEKIEQLRAMVPAQPSYEEEEEETLLTTSRFRRFLVLEVSSGSLEEIKLRTIDEATGMEHFLSLRDEWSSLEIQSGDCINIVGRVEPKGSSHTYIVDATRNLLILHPDVLVSGTMLAHTADCKRRAILNHSVKFHPRQDISSTVLPSNEQNNSMNASDQSTAFRAPSAPPNPTSTYQVKPTVTDPRHALYGTFIHELFQSAVDSLDFTIASLTQNMEKLIVDHIVNIFSIGDTEQNVRRTLTGWIPAMTDWANRFFPPTRTDMRLIQQNDPIAKHQPLKNASGDMIELGDQKYLMEVVKAMEIEEHVVSIMYGLKGDIDVSLLVKLTPLPPGTKSLRPPLPPASAAKSYLLPLEIKSGNLNASYASQVILYSLLMADRYNRDIPIALLFSLKESNTVALEITRRQVMYAIQNRNRIASFVHRPHPMPPLLGVSDPCSHCYQVESCMILHKAFESGKQKIGISPLLYESITSNLTSTRHAAFLSHWFTLIDMESSEILRYRNQVWSMPQAQREKEGRCLGAMRLVSISSHGPQHTSTGPELAETIAPMPRSSAAGLVSPLGVQTQESQPSQVSSSQKKISTGKRQLFLTFERWPLSIDEPSSNHDFLSPPTSTYGKYAPSPAGKVKATFSEIMMSPPRLPSAGSGRLKSPPSQRSRKESILGKAGNRSDNAMVDDSVDVTQTDFTPSARHVALTDLQFGLGDHVVVSDGRHLAIASCSVVEITNHSITLVCNRPFLRAPPKEYATVLPTSQRFTPMALKSMPFKGSLLKSAPVVGDIESLPGVTGMTPSQGPDTSLYPDFQNRNLQKMRWRLDRDEVQSGFNMLKGNVIQLFQSTNWARKFRRLIVDLEAPTFVDTPLTPEEEAFISGKIDGEAPLNTDQVKAVHKVLDARDYALILGMPGTGKTMTIAKIVTLLLKRGKTVLISAGTHSAVDTLLLQIAKRGIDFLRLGQPDLVHPDIRHHTLNYESSTKSVEELEKLVGPGTGPYALVGATCPGANHQLLTNRIFDYCIVDESSQITLPVILGPVRLANTLIMVGDLYQLPPVVRNAQALLGGLSTSLFKRLSEAHPSAVTKLKLQYRMNSDIMSLSNTLIYQQQLVCGSEKVAAQRLEIPSLEHLLPALQELRTAVPASITSVTAASRKLEDHWMFPLLNPDRKVVFLNTDAILEATEERLEQKDITRNPTEAALIALISHCLLKVGLSNRQIGVISPLKAQLKMIQSHLHSMGLNGPGKSIDVFTVDKYQGSDVDCLLISFVRSNSLKSVGTLLKDWRRINVAFTRAKRKIILIGSRSTLSANHLLAAFFQMVDEHNWELKLPAEALRW